MTQHVPEPTGRQRPANATQREATFQSRAVNIDRSCRIKCICLIACLCAELAVDKQVSCRRRGRAVAGSAGDRECQSVPVAACWRSAAVRGLPRGYARPAHLAGAKEYRICGGGQPHRVPVASRVSGRGTTALGSQRTHACREDGARLMDGIVRPRVAWKAYATAGISPSTCPLRTCPAYCTGSARLQYCRPPAGDFYRLIEGGAEIAGRCRPGCQEWGTT